MKPNGTPCLSTVTVQRMRITIRQARIEDNELLSTLGRATFFDSFAADNHPEDMAAYLNASFNPEKQAAELAEPSSHVLIAEVGKTPVGYARLVEAHAPPCISVQRPIRLARLYACKRWIGSGVGARLMTACIAESHRRQCDGIWLGVWGKNARAIRFYRQMKFSEVGTQPFVLGNDRQTDLILWLPLQPYCLTP